MVKYLLAPVILLSLLFNPTGLQAQTPSQPIAEPYCGTDFLEARHEQSDAAYKALKQRVLQQYIDYMEGRTPTRPGLLADPLSHVNDSLNLTVPVVIHVVYSPGTPVGTAENISDATVIAGLARLNEAYLGKHCGSDRDGLNINLQFCLARRDIFGNPSTGITRHATVLTDMDMCTQEATVKGLSQNGGGLNNPYPSTDYVNIWLVRSICASCNPYNCLVAGFSTLASSHGSSLDGFLSETNTWYYSGICDDSKVSIHEMGHFFNLYHTFEGGCRNDDCLKDGDHVCDTPPDNVQININSDCSHSSVGTTNSCHTDATSGFSSDQPDPEDNYMDYSNKGCEYRFTPGQRTVIRHSLLSTRISLLNSKGCIDPCTTPIDITLNIPGTIYQGQSTAIGATTTNATTYKWLLDTTIISTSKNFNYTFNNVGTYTLTLIAGNSDANCEKIAQQTIEVKCSLTAGFTASATNITTGSTVTFTNTSSNTGTPTYNWMMDGVSQSTNPTNWSNTFSTVGGHTIILSVTNGACTVLSNSIFIAVGISCVPSHALDWWEFGNNAQIHFTTGNVAVSTCPMYTTEGTTSICDANGNILFYTNSNDYYTRTGTRMPKANPPFNINNSTSSTRGAIIVPYPEHPGQYFSFAATTRELPSWASSAYYTLVDMSLNGGLGDLVTGTINKKLLDTCTSERVAAAKHCNGRDYWVIYKSDTLNKFWAYLVSPTGISPTPVTSTLGLNYSPHAGSGCGILGEMKFSVSAKRMVCGSNGQGFLQVFNFDASTGQFTGIVGTLGANGEYFNYYGSEFSPNERYVYFTQFGGNVTQWDLNTGQTYKVTGPLGNYQTGALQLGPDGRVYLGNNFAPYLSVINFPDLGGAACGFQPSAITLTGGAVARIGFPGYTNDATFEAQPTHLSGPKSVCSSDTGFYSTPEMCSNIAYTWTVEGPAAAIGADTSHAQLHLNFGGPGTVHLHLHIKRSCKDLDEDYYVTVNPLPIVDPIPDVAVCTGDTIFLNATGGPAIANGPVTCLWTGPNAFSSNACNTFVAPVAPAKLGTYVYTLTDNNGCHSSTSFKALSGTIGPASVTTPQAGSTVKICAGASVSFTATSPNGGSYPIYEWRINNAATGGNSPNFTYSNFKNGDKVIVHLKSSSHCVSTDTANSAPVTIQVDTAVRPARVTVVSDHLTSVCSGTNIKFTATGDNAGTTPSYKWTVNSQVVSNNPITYSSAALHNRDTVRCIFTSNATCATKLIDTSAAIIVAIDSAGTPVNTVTPTKNPVCPNQSADFTATATLGGNAPLYQWKLNGVSAGGFSSQNTFHLANVNSNDTVTCVLISNSGCVTKDTVTSNKVIMLISYTDTAAFIQIAPHPGDTICPGSPVSISSLVKGGGVSPGYQWYLNNTLVSTAGTFTSNSVKAGDSITCIVNTGALCAASIIDTSNTIYISNWPLPVADVVPATPATICNGDSVQLCAPQSMKAYQWHNSNKQSQCIYAKQVGNYYVQVTDKNGCTAESNHVTLNIFPTLSVSVTTVGDTIKIYNGKTYQWYRNGMAIPDATDSIYVIKEAGVYYVEITDVHDCVYRSNSTTKTGIGEFATTGVKLYPNPNNGNFILEFTDDIPREVTIENALGQKLTTLLVTRQTQFNLNHTSDGIYFVRITRGEEVKVVKFSLVK